MYGSRTDRQSADESRAILDRLYASQPGGRGSSTPQSPVYRRPLTGVPRVPMPTGRVPSTQAPTSVRPTLRQQLQTSSRPVGTTEVPPNLAQARGLLDSKYPPF